jgi:hypothetical protein
VKKTVKDAMLQDEEFKKKFSLEIDLVPESKDDVRLAELLQYSTVECTYCAIQLVKYS